MTSSVIQLPLLYETPVKWAVDILGRNSFIIELLNDHAHLEKKAAANALELLCRWPHGSTPAYWSRQLGFIAKEEAEHLDLVLKELHRRGGSLSRHHKNSYAGVLHKSIRLGKGRLELIDRLLVAGLIEARSCERFALLSRCEEISSDLAGFYSSLLVSEAGHYRTFFHLAGQCADQADIAIDQEIKRWLTIEADVIQTREADCTMHSGLRS